MLLKMYPKIYLLVFLLIALMITACNSSEPQSTATPTAVASQQPVETVENPDTSLTPTTSPATQEGDVDTLRLLYWQAPTILNIHLTSATRDHEASRLVYEPLASYNSNGDLVPFLAAEIPTQENGGLVNDNGKTMVTWKLRQGIQWSDGEPFTAEDVKFTYDFITNPDVASSSANVYGDVEVVNIVDNLTVQVIFNQITFNWASPFVGIRGVIIPKHIFESYNGANANDAPANLSPIGTGPYQVTEFVTEDILIIGSDVVETIKIVYEANPYFREEDKPYFKRVELRGGGDSEVAARAVLEESKADYAWNIQVSTDVLEELIALGNGSVVINPGPFVERLYLNHTDPNSATPDGEFSNLAFEHPFLSDVKVREALAYAIDRSAILDAYGSAGLSANNVIVARPPYEDPEAGIPDEYNPEKANQLLDEAGWVDTDGDNIRDKDGVKMKVLFQTSVNPLREEVQEIVKKDLEALGIEVEKKLIEISVFTAPDVTNTNNIWHFYADLQLLFYGTTRLDPITYLSSFTCDQIPQLENDWNGNNLQRWCNLEYDTLYQQANVETDFEKRREIIIEMTKLLGEEVVTIPLVQRALVSAASNDLEGFDPTPWDTEVWNIKDWRRKSP